MSLQLHIVVIGAGMHVSIARALLGISMVKQYFCLGFRKGFLAITYLGFRQGFIWNFKGEALILLGVSGRVSFAIPSWGFQTGWAWNFDGNALILLGFRKGFALFFQKGFA